MGRRSKRILLGVGIASLVALTLVGAVWLAAWWAFRPSPAWRPPLADGLPPAFREAERAFSSRVLSAFPVGSPEADLARVLEAQGFKRRDHENRRHSRFVQQSFPCKSTWSVDWDADSDGRIAHIEAHYHRVCL